MFRTDNEVLLFTASGTGAFESAVANLLSPGEKVLAVSHGNFGTRWLPSERPVCDLACGACGGGEQISADQNDPLCC